MQRELAPPRPAFRRPRATPETAIGNDQAVRPGTERACARAARGPAPARRRPHGRAGDRGLWCQGVAESVGGVGRRVARRYHQPVAIRLTRAPAPTAPPSFSPGGWKLQLMDVALPSSGTAMRPRYFLA